MLPPKPCEKKNFSALKQKSKTASLHGVGDSNKAAGALIAAILHSLSTQLVLVKQVN